MNGRDEVRSLAVQVFEPEPGAAYTLDTTAHLAGVSRRSVLVYCKSGFLQPRIEPTYGALLFDDRSIRTIRRIEWLRTLHGINLSGVRIILELTRELEHLRDEVRFLRAAY